MRVFSKITKISDPTIQSKVHESIASFPNEVILKIIWYINDEDAYNFLTCCKLLYSKLLGNVYINRAYIFDYNLNSEIREKRQRHLRMDIFFTFNVFVIDLPNSLPSFKHVIRMDLELSNFTKYYGYIMKLPYISSLILRQEGLKPTITWGMVHRDYSMRDPLDFCGASHSEK